MTPAVQHYLEEAHAARQRYLQALDQAGAWQERVLHDCVSPNVDTAFGAEHGFAAIRSPDDFRRAVPIRTYDELRPWIERSVAGEPRVLTAEDPALFFTSSGSTGGHKYIPVTQRFIDTCWMPFFYTIFGNFLAYHPEAMERADATLNLKWDPLRATGQTRTGKPHLGASQVDFHKLFGAAEVWEPGLEAPWAHVPAHITSDNQRTYFRLRVALQHDVRTIIGINPAMIAALVDQLAHWGADLIRETHDGTILGQPHGAPAPERARALERLAGHFGALRPAHVWPRLTSIYCWTGGLASLYLPHLRASFGPDVELLPAPVAASEGPVGVPLDRHPTAGPLAVAGAFLEFVHADEDLRGDSRTLLAHELREGGEYHAILTQTGGLYRYSAGDVVRVVDTMRGVPRVEYAGRRVISSVAGERLRESQIVEALRQALAATGLEVRNATCRAIEVDRAPPCYAFAVEGNRPWRPEEPEALASRLDHSLERICGRYAEARRDGKLAPATVHVVAPGTFFDLWNRRVDSGVRPAQAKDRVFQRDDAEWDALMAARATLR